MCGGRIEIELHVDHAHLTRSVGFSISLYKDDARLWHQGRESGAEIDVAVIEFDRAELLDSAVLRTFTPERLQAALRDIEVGAPLSIVGFPNGYHDTLRHLPMVRQAVIASSFGLRFQGQGFFLTDARTHHGTSRAAVLMRAPGSGIGSIALPWKLLGVHALMPTIPFGARAIISSSENCPLRTVRSSR